MAEQYRHKWKLHRQGLGGHITIRCSNEQCAGWLTIEQAEARLNEYETLKAATDRLSAEMARSAVNAKGFVGGLLSALRDYANILEGKDV